MKKQDLILVTGATGYIGGRLITKLLKQNYRVRAMARNKNRLLGRAWAKQVELVEGDVLKPETLGAALKGVSQAFYLIHSMGSGGSFKKLDLTAARHFQAAAEKAGLEHIIYLGALGDPDTDLSVHLKSRQETTKALRAGKVPVTEFKASVIVGSGSLSFEIIRYLTERLPVMICPRWVRTKTQPIGIRDVLKYLVAALDNRACWGHSISIGGETVLSYREMMLGYAKQRGLRRLLIPVPALTPRLSSYWVHFVTPVPAFIIRPLILGLRNPAVVQDRSAQKFFPNIKPMSYMDALKRSLARLENAPAETAWTDALVSSQPHRLPITLQDEEGLIREIRQVSVQADVSSTFHIATQVGGTHRWPTWNWAWQLRGSLDRLLGGVGMRRGRRDPHSLRPGDAVDFWRVEKFEADRCLLLRAEMRVPGRAWLELSTEPLADPDRGTLLRQVAYFAPKGLFGYLYWYMLYPFHALIFSSTINVLKERAEAAPSFPSPNTH